MMQSNDYNNKQAKAALVSIEALQNAIFNSANFSSIATDAKGVIQLFNVGAEHMLGYSAAEVMNKLTPADISDKQEIIVRAEGLSIEFNTDISAGFEALVYKAARSIEDIYELTYIRKDGSRFPAIVSVTALRDAEKNIIGYLLIGTDNTARTLVRAGALQLALFNSVNFSSVVTDAKGVIQIFNIGAEHMLGYTAKEVINKLTPADFSNKKELITRAQALSVELNTPISAGFEAMVYKARHGIEDIYELTYICKDGSYLPAMVSVTPLHSPHGVIIGYLLIATDNTLRKKAELALMEAKVLQNAMFKSKNFSSIATDAEGIIQLFNAGAEHMLGYSAAEVMNKLTPADISDPQELILRAEDLSIEFSTNINAGFEALVYKANHSIEDIYELTYIRKDGSRFPAEVSVTVLRDAQNIIIGYLLIASDNTARKREAEARLQLAASVFTNASEGIFITDAAGLIIDVNDTFTTITGYSRDEVIGQHPRMLQSDQQESEFYDNMWQVLLEKGFFSGEVLSHRKNGQVYPEMLNMSSVKNANGQTSNYVALFTDITPIKEHQNQLEHIAHYDILTNLPNRVLLADRLSQAMLQCSRHQQSLAVVFIDLDGFKSVNDAHGHKVGDELLIALSLRMKEALREGDTLARFGGDEFVAVFADLSKVADCDPILQRLLLAASKPITINNIVLKVSASIGVTIYPQDSADTDQLMRHADQAMYVAKESGKNRYHLFDTAQDDAIKLQQDNLEAIRRALDHHQFVLHYQPKVNMRTGLVTGVEALIRWQHPTLGLLNPIEFLPFIENNPMSIEMGEWVIDTALKQISAWQKMGLNRPLKTSVNIAAVQLQQPDFTHKLTKSLAAHPNIAPHYLELEVLETTALDDVNHVSATMNKCIALGVSFALDDFGTGYSSLTYLRRLPADLIKIDQSFIRDMLIDLDDLAIVEGIIALANSFKRQVIAEGVETIEHGTALLQLGCDLAQGYGIAKPMPASDIPAWINNWQPDASWQT
jgi:diguanylate cyclase (GGDEF)-like protein/PAS domain S-box-containing protein